MDGIQDLMKMQGLGGIGAGLGNMFGGWSNPADSAMPYFGQISDELKNYMNPYIQRGNQALDITQGQYGNLINDPSAMYNKIASGYQQSPGFQFALKQGLNAADNRNAAGGMSLSPAAEQNRMEVATGLANQDFGNYMGRATGLYNTGLSGMQGIGNMGFDASKSLSENLAAILMSQAQLAYQGQNAENQHDDGGLGSLLGGLGSFAGGGGFSSLGSLFGPGIIGA